MARYSAGARTSAGSTTLPIISLYAAAAVDGHIREIGVTNTTVTAVALKLIRLTSTGTQGAALTETSHDPAGAASSCQAFNTHSANPTLGGDLGYNVTLGAAIGSGVIWTFGGDLGLMIPTGVANGLGVIVATGTGQICDAWIVWEE
jgi:hypothetical protein